jgi:hypothetical protein
MLAITPFLPLYKKGITFNFLPLLRDEEGFEASVAPSMNEGDTFWMREKNEAEDNRACIRLL